MKKLITIILIIAATMELYSQNDPVTQDIYNKIKDIYEAKDYTKEQVAKPSGGTCFMYIDLKKKDGDIRMIRAYNDTKDYKFDHQFYFWEGKVLFVFIKECRKVALDKSNGTLKYACFEYRHFYNNGQWFKTVYTQYNIDQNNQAVNKQSLTIIDHNRAMKDKKDAEEFYSYARSGNWHPVCGK